MNFTEKLPVQLQDHIAEEKQSLIGANMVLKAISTRRQYYSAGTLLPCSAVSRDGTSRKEPWTILCPWFALFDSSLKWYVLNHDSRLCAAAGRKVLQLLDEDGEANPHIKV